MTNALTNHQYIEATFLVTHTRFSRSWNGLCISICLILSTSCLLFISGFRSTYVLLKTLPMSGLSLQNTEIYRKQNCFLREWYFLCSFDLTGRIHWVQMYQTEQFWVSLLSKGPIWCCWQFREICFYGKWQIEYTIWKGMCGIKSKIQIFGKQITSILNLISNHDNKRKKTV